MAHSVDEVEYSEIRLVVSYHGSRFPVTVCMFLCPKGLLSFAKGKESKR